jgi:hypothetical protein
MSYSPFNYEKVSSGKVSGILVGWKAHANSSKAPTMLSGGTSPRTCPLNNTLTTGGDEIFVSVITLPISSKRAIFNGIGRLVFSSKSMEWRKDHHRPAPGCCINLLHGRCRRCLLPHREVHVGCWHLHRRCWQCSR